MASSKQAGAPASIGQLDHPATMCGEAGRAAWGRKAAAAAAEQHTSTGKVASSPASNPASPKGWHKDSSRRLAGIDTAGSKHQQQAAAAAEDITPPHSSRKRSRPVRFKDPDSSSGEDADIQDEEQQQQQPWQPLPKALGNGNSHRFTKLQKGSKGNAMQPSSADRAAGARAVSDYSRRKRQKPDHQPATVDAAHAIADGVIGKARSSSKPTQADTGRHAAVNLLIKDRQQGRRTNVAATSARRCKPVGLGSGQQEQQGSKAAAGRPTQGTAAGNNRNTNNAKEQRAGQISSGQKQQQRPAARQPAVKRAGAASHDSSPDSDSNTDTEAAPAAAGAARRQRAPAGQQQGKSRLAKASAAAAPAKARVRQKQQPKKPARSAADSSKRNKGRLAALKAAETGPGSSNTTTSTPMGGAKRPIPELHSYQHAVRRVNHQIQRISTEEHLLQTFTADGWKGASKEKVRLTDELQRAELQVARCKESIRQACRYCEEVPADEVIPADAVDSAGEVDVDRIFCAKCKGTSSTDDNDLVLCDGPCNRAFHECCLSPRLVAADIPEDEGWLCPACDAKMDILLLISDYFGTAYDIDISWQDLFSEPVEEQDALRLQRLKSVSLDSPPAAGAAMAAAVAAVRTGQAATTGATNGVTGSSAVAQLLVGDLPSETDVDDESFSENDSSGEDEVRGKLQHRPSTQHKADRQAAAGSSDGSSSGSDQSESGSGRYSGSSSSAAEGSSLQRKRVRRASLGSPPSTGVRRSKRQGAADAVAAATIAAGATPRGTRNRWGRDGGAGAASRGRASTAGASQPGRRSTGSGGTRRSEAVASADEGQHMTLSRRKRRRRGPEIDYKRLHEQLFGFAAFEGDDNVFKEDDDVDYESGHED